MDIMTNNEIKKINVYTIQEINKQINNFVNIQEKETTKENYKILLTKFYNYCMENQINNITINNHEIIIKQYKANLLNNTSLASTSINNYILRLQSFFNFLGMPSKIKKLNDGYKSKPYKYLTKKEIDLLINTIEETETNQELKARNKAIIYLLFSGGLRVQELLNLTQTDLKNNIVFITGKGKARDIKEPIIIPDKTKELLNSYLKERTNKKRQCNYLFCNIQDKQMTRQGINLFLKKYAKKTDLKYNINIYPRCSSHVFRHSLARYLIINKNIPLHQVKDILRHSKIETTSKYLTNSQEELKQIRLNLL